MRNSLSIINLINTKLKNGYDLTKGYNCRPIFIVGSGRSGNTLVRRILSNEQDVYIPPETYVLGQVIKDFSNYSKLEWPVLVRLVLSHFNLSEDFHFFPTQSLRDLYFELVDLPESDRCLSTILDRFYLYMAKIVKPSATRWGDKTPLNSAHIESIYQVFPNAQFVHLVRNVYDVCLSYVKMGRYETYYDAAVRWRESNYAIEEFKKKAVNSVKTFKYEDLVVAPETNVRSLCDFLGLKYEHRLITDVPDPDILGDVKVSHYSNVQNAISSKSVGSGIRELSRETIDEIKEIAGPLVHYYGYV